MTSSLRSTCAAGLLVIAFLVAIHPEQVSAQEPFRLIPSARFLLGMESGYFWFTGEMLVPAGGRPGSGSMVNLPSDLGVDQCDGTALTLQATLLDNHLIHLDYLTALPTGVKKTPQTFRFQNRTYLQGTLLETRVDLNWLRASYGYKAVNTGSWWLAPRGGLHYVRYAATVNGESLEEGVCSNTRSLDALFPVIGFETHYVLPYGLDLGMEIEGMHLITGGFLTLAQVSAEWQMHPDVVASLGLVGRLAQRIEDNQPLNNEWFCGLFGWTLGIRFSF